MRQRKSHPPFVIKIEAGRKVELTQIVSVSALLDLPRCINRESFLAACAFFITYDDAGVRFTKTEHNNGKTSQRIVVTFPCPIKIYDSSMAEEILTTTPAFKRIWFHATEVKKEICLNGWNPECTKNTIFGTAVYLSQKKWNLDDDRWSSYLDHAVPIDRETLKNVPRDPKVIGCVLALQANEVQSDFPLESESKGNTQDHLIKYLNMNVLEDESGPQRIQRFNRLDNSSTSLRVSRNASPGNRRQNKKIAAYFLSKGIKAIKFVEHDVEVVAVFDPN
jgi:hypothetical protein